MARNTPLSTIALVALGAAWLGLPACGGKNEDPRQQPTVTEVGDDRCENATEEGDPNWAAQHEMGSLTTAFEAIAKRVPCTEEDPQECWKACGVDALGRKKLTCSGGAYVEGPCEFDPNQDFSCYRIPAPEEVHPDCPTEEEPAPRHNDPCDLPPCVVCGGDIYGPTGYDSYEGIFPPRYCICQPPVLDEDGVVVWKQRWRCAEVGTAWPCPGGCGC